jgi:hypothetical protein
MQFTLHYRGDLKSNAKPEFKHELRRHFHLQMKKQWQLEPLKSFNDFLERQSGSDEISVLRELHGFVFAPLVCQRLYLVAELDIRMLWPQAAGAIITSGGDIDNRLKTLLDSLKMPSEPTALPKGIVPQQGEMPFFCLLEDDSLVTRLSVETDYLLEPVNGSSEVELWIRVRTHQVRVVIATTGLA